MYRGRQGNLQEGLAAPAEAAESTDKGCRQWRGHRRVPSVLREAEAPPGDAVSSRESTCRC